MVTMSGSTKLGVILCALIYLLCIGYVIKNPDLVMKELKSVYEQLSDFARGVDRKQQHLTYALHTAIINENMEYLTSSCLKELTSAEREAVENADELIIHEYFDPRTHRVVCDLEAKAGVCFLMYSLFTSLIYFY